MLPSLETILIATKNKGKLREFASLFAILGLNVKSLADFPELADVDETGNTFAENAELKARTIAEQTGLPVLADDSGLCVTVLNDEPGVFSARYGGEHGNDAKNNKKLLENLAEVSHQKLTTLADGVEVYSSARFVCALALYLPNRPPVLVEGECHGYILPNPRGQGGFGYDPLFYVEQYGKTMAELTMEQKNQISHRSQALRAMQATLKNTFSLH
jgi:XTP/dITP diphosphohydrolase